MADHLSYSLLVNGVACEVQVEGFSWGSTESAGAAAASASSSVRTVRAFPTPGLAFAGPTQAAWVTARRVAHLPFH